MSETGLQTVPSGSIVQGEGTDPLGSLIARRRIVNSVMTEVMQKGSDYDTIPGCGTKPSLLKPGAEKLCSTFGFAPSFRISQKDLGDWHREYEIVAQLIHVQSGNICGEGVGCCSTMESKYRWRESVRKCPACGKEAIIKGKQEYGGGWLCFQKKGGCGKKWADGAKEIEGQAIGRVENADVADQYNTVLKMAKKRALVDVVLTVTAASDLFTQDIEEFARSAEEVDHAAPASAAPPPVERPKRKVTTVQEAPEGAAVPPRAADPPPAPVLKPSGAVAAKPAAPPAAATPAPPPKPAPKTEAESIRVGIIEVLSRSFTAPATPEKPNPVPQPYVVVKFSAGDGVVTQATCWGETLPRILADAHASGVPVDVTVKTRPDGRRYIDAAKAVEPEQEPPMEEGEIA